VDGSTSPARAAAIVIALLVAAGCTTSHRPRRTSVVPVSFADADLGDRTRRAAVAASSVERHDGFTVGIVELDDQGRFWDRRQLRALEAEVLGQEGGPEDPGVVLTVFVHGWRHDARVCDANVALDDGRQLLAASAPPTSVPDGPDSGWIGQPCEPYRRLGPLALECKAPGRRGNPFFVVRDAPDVLHEHGAFFNPYFVSFLRRLLIDATAGTTTPEDLSPTSR
jgi:hypothetical protein